MICFSTLELMDEQKCYEYLVKILHPGGLGCPACHCPVEHAKVHRRDRAPLLYFRCVCGRIYNAFAATLWQGTQQRWCTIVRILQGIAQGVPTRHLAKELGLDRKHLLERRHQIQQFAEQACDREPLADEVVEADELYQNAGEKGLLHSDPEDPPRQPSTRPWHLGHGLSSRTGDCRPGQRPDPTGCKKNSARQDLEPSVLKATREGSTINTDEWGAYRHLSETKRHHVTVCHTPGKRVWARDDDGDGIREVHNNTIEGSWTGVRNFLRPFRGVTSATFNSILPSMNGPIISKK